MAMKSIHKYVYAAVLTLSALNFAPSLASAQEAAGSFTLDHEVHWQNTLVPPGTYRFTVGAHGPTELLMVRDISGHGTGFMLLVSDTEVSKPLDVSRMIIVSRPNGSFVSSMQLPEFGLTLHFAVPSETREVAKAVTPTTLSAR
jgi:hypothetical protein